MDGMRSSSPLNSFACLLLLTTATSEPVCVEVSTDKLVSTTDEHFVGVTLDSRLLPVEAHWGGLDFRSEKVQVLAKSISPSFVRIGGYAGDHIAFDPTGHGSTEPNETFTCNTWDALNTFVQAVGWKLVFALNVLKRTGPRWDPTNARQLLLYSSKQNYNIVGFELGNEPQYFPGPKRISGKQLGEDFGTLTQLLSSHPGFNSTLVIGPDSVDVIGDTATVFREFFAGVGRSIVDRITFHQYYAYKGAASVDLFTDPDVMDRLKHSIEAVHTVTTPSSPGTPVWLGETSSCWGGGAPGFSDRYIAGFLWLDKLGVASRMGIDVVMRQDFYGSNYSLIEKDTFEPNPDYWLTLLYKRLVGRRVMQVWTSGTRYLRIYAHCTRRNSTYGFPEGSITVYYLNVHTNSSESTEIKFPQFLNKSMFVYSLAPDIPGNLTNRYMKLNGKRIEFMNNKIPELTPRVITTGLFSIPAKTFGFVVIPEADVRLCRS